MCLSFVGCTAQVYPRDTSSTQLSTRPVQDEIAKRRWSCSSIFLLFAVSLACVAPLFLFLACLSVSLVSSYAGTHNVYCTVSTMRHCRATSEHVVSSLERACGIIPLSPGYTERHGDLAFPPALDGCLFQLTLPPSLSSSRRRSLFAHYFFLRAVSGEDVSDANLLGGGADVADCQVQIQGAAHGARVRCCPHAATVPLP